MAGRQQGSGDGTELGRFLRARRTQTSPEEAGIQVGPGWRRTPGLRREELASLAGVSVDYYTRLERGKETRPSPAVIDALARALHLGETEHEHLFDLVNRVSRPRAEPARQTAPPGTELLLERLRPYPARVLSRTMDILAGNTGAQRMLPGIERWPAHRHNIARYVFLHPAAHDVFEDFDTVTAGCVARLRALAGVEPDAPDLAALVDELRVNSPEFAGMWERYQVRPYGPDSKTIKHPEVGRLTLQVQSMRFEGAPGQRLVIYYATPGTPDHDALILLDRMAEERVATPAQRQRG